MVLTGGYETWSPPEPTSVTIGVLDGVHRGHRALLAHLDQDMNKTVLTFDPHPVEVLRPGTPARLLTLLDERLDLLAAAGVDITGVLDLSDIKELEPEEFIRSVLLERVNMRHLVVGHDFRFGRGRSGDVETLRALGAEHGFDVEKIQLVPAADGEAISSSRVRLLVEKGDVAAAADLLGSRYTVTNVVGHGDKRGREIGYPTANLEPPNRKLIPARGVYACFAHLAGETHRAAVNVGIRPTFGGEKLLIEAYILDFNSQIYGQELTIEFVSRLRPELDFDTVESLVERMDDDVKQTRSILDSTASGI